MDIVGQHYSAAGAPIGAATELNSVIDVANESGPSVASLAGGGFLMTYGASLIRGIELQKLDADGSAAGAVSVYAIPPFTQSKYSASDACVAAASGTSAAVAYTEFYSSPPLSFSSVINLQIVDPSTMTLGALVRISSGVGAWSDPTSSRSATGAI